MGAPLASWPWENLGTYKYLLCGPLVAKAAGGRAWERASPDHWCFLLSLLFFLRAATYRLWAIFTNMLFLNRRRVIARDGVDFQQIDKEWHWDNFLILQFWLAAAAVYAFPSLRQLPPWDARGAAAALLLHVAATEPLFYLLHRTLHTGRLFADYHSLHHSSRILQPYSAGFATPLEILAISALMAVPVAAACAAGLGSAWLVFGYTLAFDFLRAMGHCNVEVFPGWLFQTVPAARYLIATPTYHTIHHTDKDSNFCLFMPLFDLFGGTLNDKSWELQKRNSAGTDEIPDFVFLIHLVDVTASLHNSLTSRSYASLPYRTTPAALVHWPSAFVIMLAMWAWSKTFVVYFYRLRGRLFQTWVVPRYGFQYFLPFAKDGINKQIEEAILRADKMGVKVVGLGALNKQRGSFACACAERGAERRGHAVRGESPGPAGARRPREHAHGGGDPAGDPRGHGGGVPDRRHLQARPRHRALPLPEEGPRHDADGVGGEVPEDPGGGAAGVPAVPGPGHRVPVGPALQDVDRGEVAVAAAAAVGAGGHALPPVRGAAHPPLPPGLHLRRARRHAPARRRPGPRRLRVHPGARRGARVPRGRRRALPGGVRGPRGRRHRRRPHRRRVGGRDAPQPAPRLIDRPVGGVAASPRARSGASLPSTPLLLQREAIPLSFACQCRNVTYDRIQ
ncbi:hypothetical protein PVAP13_6KG287900 [Panicum virgatum]|uniref:aldehyde oxygenase (deformylating) n=1 Tax=Panicum virgatum TaxID=38727 RepID=A0A8T0RGF8_PANVG|nr:hypothetical protein PVAP13_6KG287900 [Panicum virgatum]